MTTQLSPLTARSRPARQRTPNPRAGLRRTLMLAGIVPSLIALGFALKVATMLDANAEGRDAFDRGDHDGAALLFADTGRLNWFERWVAPFDEGASEHADGRLEVAIGLYGGALRVVPSEEECTVRINLSLAHEALGDQANADGARESARESWQTGIDVLAAGDCPTDSGRGEEQTAEAAEVDRRLREKLDQSQQEQPPPPPQEGEQPEDNQPPPPDPREDELEQNNQRGQDQRREDQELYEDEDYSRPETW